MFKRATLLLMLVCVFGSETTSAEVVKDTWISLHSYAFDTMDREPILPKHLRIETSAYEKEGYYLVKFPGPITTQNSEQLQEQVKRVYTYLPYFSYLVKMEHQKKALTKKVSGASWIGAYHPAYKMSADLAAITATDTREHVIVMIQVYPDAPLETIVQKVQALGIQKVEGYAYNPFFSRMRVLLSPREVVLFRDKIARIRDVFYIDREPRKVFLNDTTIWVGQSGVSGGQTTPVFDHGLYGEGQIITALDTGIDADMCYFYNSALATLPPRNECDGGTVVDLNQRKVIAVDFLWSSECSGGISSSEWDTQDHGTHVAGIMAGDDFANPLIHDPGDGMAPGAKLVIQDCGYQTNDCADCPGIGCPVTDLNPVFQQTYDQGTRIHSNSWGDNENASVQNYYTTASEDVDEFMWNHPDFLLFFAAGNSGPSTASVGSPSTAKSCVSVGATNRGSSAESLAFFSSLGPTDDNRLKPEVTIPGSGIISANNDGDVTSFNCNTQSMSGTSMACPAAAGLTALIRQYFTDGWYPSGTEIPADGFTPAAALLRAALINSAQNMTGVSNPIPSNEQGWGRILLDNVLYWDGETRKLWLTEDTGFPTGSSESRQYIFNVTSATDPFKVTLAWTDYPSTPAASPNINNDLDLSVEAPDMTTYLGNDFSGGESTTGGSADRLNTLEQVLFLTPATGQYTVTVQAYNIPNGTQPFALVVTGDLASGPHASYTSDVITDSCGVNPGDGVIDPGETVVVEVSVYNDGLGDLTNVVGTLSSSTVGVTITDGTATFPDILSGGTQTCNSPYFTYVLDETFTCGGTIDLTLDLSYNEGSNSTSFSHSVGTEVTIYEDDFEGSTGWSHDSGNSTAGTGDFIVDDPVATSYQPGDDATPAGVYCFFSAQNPSGFDGTDDVDDGYVTGHSEIIDLSSYTDASLRYNYFFGQRDPGDDPGGDWFRIDLSNDGGTSYTVNLVQFDDVSHSATWIAETHALNSLITLTDQMRIRIQASDGATTGDIIEAGIDDVEIFANQCNVCSSSANPPGAVPDNDVYTGTPLTIIKSGSDLDLSWGAPGGTCSTDDYGIYRGSIPFSGYDHTSALCTTGGATSDTIAADTGSYYFLVVAQNDGEEGSYGLNSSSVQRPAASTPCSPQNIGTCN